MNEKADWLEYTTPEDVFYDFCLWEYQPVTPPGSKLNSANLLFNSFEATGMPPKVFDFLKALREALGTSHTVWGTKNIGEKITWEFYFYDYRRRERERSISRVIEALQPFVRCDLRANENLHYFMFSIDIDGQLISGGKELEEIHLYVDSLGGTVSSGIAYSLTRRGTRLENFYFFFDAARDIDQIRAKIVCSAYNDFKSVAIDQILWPELRNCRVIVVANKQQSDAVYFSRIDIHQLLFFLRRLGYPKEIVGFVEENRSRLDHLLYDVGFDYRTEGRDLVILKSGYYGVF